MATSDGRCFVYVRYWPGFANNFPYERFNGLPEKEFEGALRAALAEELWRRHDEIMTRRKVQKQKLIEAIKRRQRQGIARAFGSPRRREPPATKPRKTRCSRFTKLAWYVGWHKVGEFFSRKTGEYLFTPKIWIADLESAACANDLMNELTELPPVNDEEWERHELINPRYGVVSWDALSRREQASVLSAIQQLWANEPLDWADLARPLLTRVKRFLDAWQAIAHSASLQAVDNGVTSVGENEAQKVNEVGAHDEVRAHREKLFPRGIVGIDQDIIDLVVRLDTERPEKSDIQIARDFYARHADAESKSKKALARVRRLRLDGKTSLPPRA